MNFCTNCGSPLSNDDKFCKNCGKLVSEAPVQVIPVASPSPEKLHGTPVGLLIFSIINTVLGAGALCFCNFFTIALGIWGIIASSLASNKPMEKGKNLCKISLIVNIIASVIFLLWVIGYIVYVVIMFNTMGGMDPGSLGSGYLY